MPERWRAESPELAKLLRGAETPGEANIVGAVFETVAKVQRTGIVTPPDFMVRNVLMDQLTAFVADPLHPPPYITMVRGAMHVLSKDATYRDFLAKGGMGSALVDMDVDVLARDMSMLEHTGTLDRAINVVKHPLEALQLLSERLDASSRVGYFEHAKSKGIDPIKAATMSRKAYIDFAERATLQWVNMWAKWVPFFRPSLLGMKQIGEGFANDPVGSSTRAVLGVTVPSVALFLLNWGMDKAHEDDETYKKYRDRPQWEKDNFWVLPSVGGVSLKLRKPREIGAVFGTTAERTMDKFLNDNPKAFKGLFEEVMKQFIPPVLPPLVTTPLELATNHSLFTGREIVPNSLEDAHGDMQFTDATSETGKKLSRAMGEHGADILDFSPMQFDYLVRAWTGSAGKAVLDALDLPQTPEGTGKPFELADVPFAGSFFARNPTLSAAPISDFFDELKELEKDKADFQLAMKRAVQGQGSESAIEEGPEAFAAQAFAAYKHAMTLQMEVIKGINNRKDLTADEKRTETDKAMWSLIGTARNGTAMLRRYKAGQSLEPGEPAPEEPTEEVLPEELPSAPAPEEEPAPAPDQSDLDGPGMVPIS